MNDEIKELGSAIANCDRNSIGQAILWIDEDARGNDSQDKMLEILKGIHESTFKGYVYKIEAG